MIMSEFASVRMGTTFRGRGATRPADAGTCLLVRIADITHDSTWSTRDFLRIAPRAAVPPGQFLRPGDVLFPNRGTRTTAIVFDVDLPCVLAGAQFLVIRPRTGIVVPDYLAWYLRSEESSRYFERRRKGSHVPAIELGDLATLDVPLPPLPVQRAISELAALAAVERNLSERIAHLAQCQLNAHLARRARSAAATGDAS